MPTTAHPHAPVHATGGNPVNAAGRAHLSAHLSACDQARSRLHRLRGAAELVDGVVLPRFATTLAVLLVLAAASLWWLA